MKFDGSIPSSYELGYRIVAAYMFNDEDTFEVASARIILYGDASFIDWFDRYFEESKLLPTCTICKSIPSFEENDDDIYNLHI